MHLFGWAWLHDLDENDYIGIIKRGETEKLADNVWKTIIGKAIAQLGWKPYLMTLLK